jgi:hypothetical protein
MGHHFNSARPNKAMRLVRQLVRSGLDWGDLEVIVAESIKYPEKYHELLAAISADFVKKEQRLYEISKEIDQLGNKAAEKLFGEYSDLHLDQEATKLTAWFELGYATALRLLDRPPDVEVISGGNKEPRLRGNSNL